MKINFSSIKVYINQEIQKLYSVFAPILHSHGNITSNGMIGSSNNNANKNVVTNQNGQITIENKPEIPSKISDLTDDSDFIEKSSTPGYIKNDGSVGTPPNTTYTADNNSLQLSNNQFSVKSGGITSSHIANGTIKNEDIASNTTIDFSKLNISKSNITGLGIPAQDTTYTASTMVGGADTSSGTTGTSNAYARADHTHKQSSLYATSSHNHDGTYLKSYTPPTGSTSTAGIVKLNNTVTSTSTTEAATANAVKTAYDKGNHSHPYAASSHSHGNITNAGAIGSTANLPIITDSNGVLKTGSFGTAANTFCQGNDSRLSNARTPTSHNHGNITNAGAIGSTANLPIITDSNGVLKTGSFGTAANTFCQGNDSRLSDARQPKSIYISAGEGNVKDLDTYTTTGFYYNSSNAQAQYIIHCPNSDGTATPYSLNRAFFLLVEDWGTGNYTKQTLTYYIPDHETYIRTRNAGTWGKWYKLDVEKYNQCDYKDVNNLYLKIMRINITSNYADTPIKFTVINRRSRIHNVELRFVNQGDKDPQVREFYVKGGDSSFYIAKDSTSTWTIYYKKQEGYDNITITDLKYNNPFNITFPNLSVASLPTSNILEATYKRDNIGGNLLQGTKAFVSNSAPVATGELYNGCVVKKLTGNNSSYQDIYWDIPKEHLEVGGVYTLSFWARTTATHGYVNTYFYQSNITTKRLKSNGLISHWGEGSSYGDGGTQFYINQAWTRYYVTYQLLDTGTFDAKKRITIRLQSNTNANNDLFVAGVKLEKGNQATDYCENPKDVLKLPASVNVVTDATGQLITEAKNNHSHNYLPTNANGTTIGTLTATKFINSSSNNTNILLGNGNTIAQSKFATSEHSHPYISTTAGSVGTNNLASQAVTSDKIANGTIVNEDISTSAGIDASKIIDSQSDRYYGLNVFYSNMAQKNINLSISEALESIQRWLTLDSNMELTASGLTIAGKVNIPLRLVYVTIGGTSNLASNTEADTAFGSSFLSTYKPLNVIRTPIHPTGNAILSIDPVNNKVKISNKLGSANPILNGSCMYTY